MDAKRKDLAIAYGLQRRFGKKKKDSEPEPEPKIEHHSYAEEEHDLEPKRYADGGQVSSQSRTLGDVIKYPKGASLAEGGEVEEDMEHDHAPEEDPAHYHHSEHIEDLVERARKHIAGMHDDDEMSEDDEDEDDIA